MNIRIIILYTILLMGLLSCMSIPLYYILCNNDFTSNDTINNKEDLRNNYSSIDIYFDTEVEKKLPWIVNVEKNKMNIQVGKVNLVYFHIKNVSDKNIIGYSVFDIAPRNIAQFFIKIQCFCFENQLIRSGEEVRFPLLFIIDDKILDFNISSLTMYYYFSLVKTI